MVINTKFNFGQSVYLITDSDQNERIITGIQLNGESSLILYRLSFVTTESWHYDYEISAEVNEKLKPGLQ